MKKSIAAAALILSTAAFAFAGHGAPGMGEHQGRHHERMEKLASKLNLSDAQKAQMKDIRQQNRQANQQLHADLKAKHQEYRQLKEANDPRAAEVKTQLQSLRAQAKAARTSAHEQMLTVLTADQRQQLEQMRAERQQRHAAHEGGQSKR